VVEEDIAAQKSASDEDDELENEPSDDAPEGAESQPAAAEPTTARWAIRGAVVGAVAGSAVGAGVAVLVARRPEALRQVTGLIGGNARQIASAAGVAAAGVVASKGLNQLVSGDENGDRGQLMKQSAKEAGAAAAKAARDTLVSLRQEAGSSG
jgi:hypothetical protein